MFLLKPLSKQATSLVPGLCYKPVIGLFLHDLQWSTGVSKFCNSRAPLWVSNVTLLVVLQSFLLVPLELFLVQTKTGPVVAAVPFSQHTTYPLAFLHPRGISIAASALNW